MTVFVEATTAQHGNCTGIFLIRFLHLGHASTHQRLPLGAQWGLYGALWGALLLFGGAILALWTLFRPSSPQKGARYTYCKSHPRNSWSTHLPPAPPHGVAVAAVRSPRRWPSPSRLAGPASSQGPPDNAGGMSVRCRAEDHHPSHHPLASTPCACAGAGPAAFSPRARSGTTAVAHTACAQRCTACGPDVLAEIKPDLTATHCLRAGPACEPRQDPTRHRHGRLRYGPARVGAARRVIDAPPPLAPPSRRW